MSCNLENKKLTGLDTAAVFSEVLESKSFLEDNVIQDTLYFIKSKFYNPSYPKRTKYFDIIFIDDLPINRTLNDPRITAGDKRLRFDIVKFDLKNDILNLSIVDCGTNMSWEYKLVRSNKNWEVLNENVILN